MCWLVETRGLGIRRFGLFNQACSDNGYGVSEVKPIIYGFKL